MILPAAPPEAHRPARRASWQPSSPLFAVLPRRWMVEPSSNWFTHWGGLLREQQLRRNARLQ